MAAGMAFETCLTFFFLSLFGETRARSYRPGIQYPRELYLARGFLGSPLSAGLRVVSPESHFWFQAVP
jgi:hypothetical protein